MKNEIKKEVIYKGNEIQVYRDSKNKLVITYTDTRNLKGFWREKERG